MVVIDTATWALYIYLPKLSLILPESALALLVFASSHSDWLSPFPPGLLKVFRLKTLVCSEKVALNCVLTDALRELL